MYVKYDHVRPPKKKKETIKTLHSRNNSNFPLKTERKP